MKYKYWWPDMQEFIIDYGNACIVCQQHNYSRKKKPGHLHPASSPRGPFQLIAVALPDCRPQTTARVIFEEYTCKYGVPTTILSDQVSHFLNQLMEALTVILGHNHIYSTCYHPQTNGIVERFNATFVPQLSKLQDTEMNKWDEFLPSIIFAYNTGQYFSTGYSPFQLRYGQQPRLPPDDPPKMVIFNKQNDCYQQLKKNLQIYHKHARQNMLHQQHLSKTRYNRNREDPHHNINDLVLTRIYCNRSKLDEKFSKVPFRIIEFNHPSYWVQDIEIDAIARVHVNDLRLVLEKKLD